MSSITLEFLGYDLAVTAHDFVKDFQDNFTRQFLPFRVQANNAEVPDCKFLAFLKQIFCITNKICDFEELKDVFE